MKKRPAKRVTLADVAGEFVALVARVASIEKRCRGCPHSRRAVGFTTEAVGEPIEQDEGDETGESQ